MSSSPIVFAIPALDVDTPDVVTAPGAFDGLLDPPEVTVTVPATELDDAEGAKEDTVEEEALDVEFAEVPLVGAGVAVVGVFE